MQLSGKVAVVTGGANGIGRALCRRFAIEGARGVVVADVDAVHTQEAAEEIGAVAVQCDVSKEADIKRLVDEATAKFGQIDLFVSNAGIAIGGGAEAADSEWERIWKVNFMSRVWAARHVLPQMLARGDGYLLSTASAAGLLSSIGSAPYAVTKHADVAFAEWLSITHGPAIKVSCLCPQGVFTNMLMHPEAGPATAALRPEAISPEEVADFVIRGLAEEKFLILPHPIVAEYVNRKANDRDRWIAGMRKIQAKILAASGGTLM